jgi:hypothetical protein
MTARRPPLGCCSCMHMSSGTALSCGLCRGWDRAGLWRSSSWIQRARARPPMQKTPRASDAGAHDGTGGVQGQLVAGRQAAERVFHRRHLRGVACGPGASPNTTNNPGLPGEPQRSRPPSATLHLRRASTCTCPCTPVARVRALAGPDHPPTPTHRAGAPSSCRSHRWSCWWTPPVADRPSRAALGPPRPTD